jgi:crotonobetainyl-CoA:carnitine CoA-transferase CaiB-like acyl-CoA transferase
VEHEEAIRLLLRQAWSALGGDLELLDLVQVTGQPAGLLPSTLAALPAMTAAVAVSTLAAAVLDRSRGSAAWSPVVVDVEHVALAARSERYARTAAAEAVGLFAPLSRFFRTADGWIRLHANYPWHRERALKVLGCDHRPDAVERAVLAWPGEALEEALAAAGALGYVVRDVEAWRAHPQGQAVSGLPLVQTRAGREAGRVVPSGRTASGMRVLDLTRVIAGPVATRTLAGWGAEVLRLDSPDLPEIPAQAVDTLPGKRSAELDLRQPEGRDRMEVLLGQADLLIQGYRPGTLARYGLDAQELAGRHPHLIVVSLSAWGSGGPWAGRRGFDSLVQCPTGIAVAEGGDDGGPGALPAQVLDHATGYLAAAASMLALADVQHGRPARTVQLSLAQTAQWLLSAGTMPRLPEREPDVGAYLVTLPGASSAVQVVRAPGRAGDLTPTWNSTSDLGAHPAAFSVDDA